MKKRLIETEKRETVAAAEAKISQVVACVDRETAKGRIVKSEAIAASTGMKRGVEKWINVAAKRGLIHFANNQEGWKHGPYVPVILPKTEASPIIVQTADWIRALSNGRPASTMAVAKRLGMKREAAIWRLHQAVACGLVVSAGFRKGW